jgi:choline dehydrogenase-like flavoprotein
VLADARSVSMDETVETDVCIVGAGLAGLTVAHEFIGQDVQVLLLESGDLTRDDETQSLYEGDSVGLPYYRLEEARARYVGGSSNYWDIDIGGEYPGVRLRPLDAIDFEERDWIEHSGWPFTRAHLDPFYERAQSIFGIKSTTFDVGRWSDARERSRLAVSERDVASVIFKFGSQDVYTVGYRNDIVRHAENVIVLVHANVVEIETDARAQSARRVRVACLHGNRFWVTAKIFIVATGGIEVPRLLLASNTVQAAGLGNQHDLVGRYFMEHLHFWSGVYVPAPIVVGTMGLYSQIRRVDGVPVVAKLALTESALRRERLLNQCVQLMPETVTMGALYPGVVSRGTSSLRTLTASLTRGTVPDRGDVGNVVLGFGDVLMHAYHKARRTVDRRRQRIRAFRLAHMTEQVPNHGSRVRLATERDALGERRAQLEWRLSPVDIHSVVRTQRVIDTALRRAGVGRLYTQLRDDTPPIGAVPAGVHGGYHHMGTTRMHADPRRGVVDPNSRVHGVSNLFVAGPSVFPTGGYANPVLTVVALSLRLADHVKQVVKAVELG